MKDEERESKRLVCKQSNKVCLLYIYRSPTRTLPFVYRTIYSNLFVSIIIYKYELIFAFGHLIWLLMCRQMVFYFTPLRIIQRDEQWTHPIGHALSSVKKKRRANINSRVCRTFLLTTEEEKKNWLVIAGWAATGQFNPISQCHFQLKFPLECALSYCTNRVKHTWGNWRERNRMIKTTTIFNRESCTSMTAAPCSSQ